MLSGIPAFVLFAAGNNHQVAENAESLRLGGWLLRPQVVVLVIIRVGRMQVLRQWMFL
jgi:hypothetical protein